MSRCAARSWPLAILAVVLTSCADAATGVKEGAPVVVTDTAAPAIRREIRGLWIATVANIDWPTRTNLTADQQRAELADLMTRAATTGINAIIFQVRPASDAVYRSAIEPWASLLTGT